MFALPNGEVVIANSGTGELRFYDADGNFRRSFGSIGRGPGEFESLSWAAPVGKDTLLAWDSSLGRLSLFDVERGFLDTRTLETVGTARPMVIGAWRDGLVLGSVRQGAVFAGERLVQDSLDFVSLDLEGQVIDSLGRYPNRVHYSRVTRRGSGVNFSSVLAPFARTGKTAIAKEGFYFGTGKSYDIGFYSRSGSLKRTIRRPVENRPVTEDLRLRWLDGVTSQTHRSMLESAPFPTTVPAYRDLLVDDVDNLWVRDYELSDEVGSKWQIFDPTGRWLGSLDLPARFEPSQIGSDFVLGIRKDATDVEHVQMYRLLKPSHSSSKPPNKR